MMRWWDNEVFVRTRSASEDELLKLRTQLIKETDERIANESVGKRKHNFRVEAETERLERVGVTGGCNELGNWGAAHVVLLDREGDTNIWSKDILIPLLTTNYVFYRYVVVTDENYAEENPKRNEGGSVKSIRRWEANPKFRRIDPITNIFQASSSFRKEYLNMSAEQIKIMRREQDFDVKRAPEKFGTNRKDTTISKGWLTRDNALHLKLFRGNLKFYGEKYRDCPIYTKVRALRVMSDSGGTDDFCEDPDDGWPLVEVSVLNTKSSRFHRQDKYGTRICGIENIIYQIFHETSETLGLVFDYYVYKKSYKTLEPNTDIPLHVAFSVVHPCTMPDHEGEIKTDVCSIKGPTIGEIKLKYVFFKNTQPLKFKFFQSLPHRWSKMWASSDGGSVIHTCSEVRENTLTCVEETAQSKGYDFVEISLQTTNDGIPVFSHSPYLVVGIKNISDYVPLEQFQVPVTKFTLHQLHRMRRMPLRECGNFMKITESGLQKHDHNSQPFPTLMQLLNGVGKNVGFVIELNTMGCLEDGTYEAYHKNDVNVFVYNVLKTLQQSAGKRSIILASFHPDICSMMKLKQNMYPVVFLHDGIPDKYTGYDKDVRCNNLDNAISFADCMDLQGLGVNCDTLVSEDNAMKIVRRNLVVYCTEEPNDAGAAQKRLAECKMNGIICTRRDAYGKMRRPLGYVLEPKGRERYWIRGWAEDTESDGYLKPEVHPIEIPHYQLAEYYTKKAGHQIPAGLQQFPSGKHESKDLPVSQVTRSGKVEFSDGSLCIKNRVASHSQTAIKAESTVIADSKITVKSTNSSLNT